MATLPQAPEREESYDAQSSELLKE